MLYLLDGLTFRIILFHSIFYFFLTWCLVLAARCLAIDPSFGAVFCKMFWCFRAFFSKLLTPFRKLNQKDEISKGSSLAKNKSFSVSFFVSHSDEPIRSNVWVWFDRKSWITIYWSFTWFNIFLSRYDTLAMHIRLRLLLSPNTEQN